MKKLVLSMLVISIVLSFAACGNNDIDDGVNATEEATEMTTGIVPNSVKEGSEADIAVRNTVAEYLDTFISCDIEAIKNMLHEDDKWLFNFGDDEQLAFYEAIFPRIKYEFEFVSEYEGVYGVMCEVTSPDMAEVYGSIITDYIDSSTGNSNVTAQEIMSQSTEKMLEMIASPGTKERCERLYIYVEYIDGVYIPRCDAFLANELTGGAPEFNDEITSTIYQTVDALTE